MNASRPETEQNHINQPLITDDELQLVEALQRYEAMVRAELTNPLRAAAAARDKKEQTP